MPKQRIVILWGQNDLLTKAMEMVLTAGEADAWEVIKLPGEQCITALVEQVRKAKPDLVILYQAMPDDADPLTKLMREQPDLRMISVSLENNVMQVYSKRSITLRQVSDLLSVIEDRHFSENPVSKEVHKI
jgi:DNA-binding NarL/FixJ family response regulator